MRRAFLPLLVLAGTITYVNPQEHVDLSRIRVSIPVNLTALGGDVHIFVYDIPEGRLQVRLLRDDDEKRVLLTTILLEVDFNNQITLPCGHFSRGGTYYLEIMEDYVDVSVIPISKVLANVYEEVPGFLSREMPEVKRFEPHNAFKEVTNSERKTDVSNGRAKRDVSNSKIKRDVSNSVIKREEIHSDNTNDYGFGEEVSSRLDEDKYHPEKDLFVSEAEGNNVKTWKFHVDWPSAKLQVTPDRIHTYPSEKVSAVLEFPKVLCTPLESSADFWLELLYCGHSTDSSVLCDGRNTSSNAHVLYSEQVYGFPGRRTMPLRCELFGQAGDYTLTLRPAAPARPEDWALAHIKADWSDEFLLTVSAPSIFPCGDGVRALFQYPQCILEGADRVRLFGQDNDRLKYITERRVRRGQHSTSFDCALFSEKYPEYCFVYVSQAVTGAVSDVKMNCMPTMPVTEGGAGAWGEWSPWSACPPPSLCSTRTRSRHRFCDSPPPAYGAKYCEGQAVELAACECTARPWAGDSSVVIAEVGARCRCGCVLHLAPTARLLAGSARACPERSFWLLQAEEGLGVRVRMESVRLMCAGQSLKIRDGDSLAAPLLASWDGPNTVPDANLLASATDTIMAGEEFSGGRHILVELRSGETGDDCPGGFLAHAFQFEPHRNASAAWSSLTSARWWRDGGAARGSAVALAAGAALAALCLALHSAQRNRAYQRAADKESLTDSDACSASLEMGIAATGSRSTLLSDVVGGVSLRRLLPGHTKHTRLRDEDRASGDPQRDDEEDQNTDNQDLEDPQDHIEPDTASVGATSATSQATVTPENVSSSSAPAGTQIAPPPLKARTVSAANISLPPMISPPQQSTSETAEELSTSVTSVSERDTCSEKDRDSAWEKDRSESRASSSTSAATLTNGWYSPALSGVSAARIRDNPKHTKESCNRRLLRSDLSLSSHAEMEIDYYDYEVNNAVSVPGSYLGMDPAFLVWIPPLEEGHIISEIGNKAPIYEEILPKELHPDPGSNTESPEDRPTSSSSDLRKQSDNQSVDSYDSSRSRNRTNIIHPLNFSISDLQNSPNNKRKKRDRRNIIPLKDLTLSRSPVKVHKRGDTNYDNSATLKRVRDTERETVSESVRKDAEYTDFKFADDNSDSSSDIKFADDSPDSNRLVDKYEART